MPTTKMRWQHGDTKPVVTKAVAPAIEIAHGDFVSIAPAPLAAVGDAPNFLGVSMQRSRVGDEDPIRVATCGVFDHPCTPDTFELGDYVAIAGPQLLVKTANEAEAIGLVEQVYETVTNRVQWQLISRVLPKDLAS